MRYLVAWLVVVMWGGAAVAAPGNELTYKAVSSLETLGAGSVTSSDYIPVYDASSGKVKKMQADTGSLITTANPGTGWFNICGEATTVNNNTVYYGPSIVLLASSGNGQMTVAG